MQNRLVTKGFWLHMDQSLSTDIVLSLCDLLIKGGHVRLHVWLQIEVHTWSGTFCQLSVGVNAKYCDLVWQWYVREACVECIHFWHLKAVLTEVCRYLWESLGIDCMPKRTPQADQRIGGQRERLIIVFNSSINSQFSLCSIPFITILK